MYMSHILKEQAITRYQLSKTSGIAYTTLNDICMGKTRIEKCSVETLYKLAKALNCTMEQLVEQSMEENSRTISFEAYKSNICHRVKALGDIPFIIETLKSQEILHLYECEQYAQAFYLLAMVDYLSRETGLPLCSEYREIRKHCLDKPIYPQGVIAMALALGDDTVKTSSKQRAIPEFTRFNIIESEVRNVV